MIGYVLAGLFIAFVAYLAISAKTKDKEEESDETTGAPGPPSPPEPPEQVEETLIENLDLNGRIVDVLKNNGVTTTTDLEKWNEDYTQLHGIGPKRAEKIEEALKE